MKIKILLAALGFTVFTQAQETIKKVPQDAVMAASFNCNNVTSLMSVPELDQSILGRMILSQLHTMDSKSSLADFGFDLHGSAQYFMQSNDSITYHTVVLPLASDTKFESFIETMGKKEVLIEEEFHTIEGDLDGASMLWDERHLVLIFATLADDYFDNEEVGLRYSLEAEPENGYDNWGDYRIESAEDTIEEAVESVEDMPEADEEEPGDIAIYEEESIDSTDYEIPEYVFEISANEKIKKELAAAWSFKKAKEVLRMDAKNNILNDKFYAKSIDPKAVVSFYISDMSLLMKGFLGSMNKITHWGNNPFGDLYANNKGNRIAYNLYMNDNDITVESITEMNQQFTKMYKKVTDRKLNPNFYNFINEDKNIGYAAFSLNTEEILKEYPDFVKESFRNNGSIGKIVGLASDIFTTVLDEEAIGKVISGDALLLFNDIDEKEVTYTSYDYNEDFEYVETEETKMETVPDFMLMFSSKDTSLFSKLMNYAIEEEGAVKQNGYYEIVDKGDVPFDIFVVLKEDMVIVCTSEMDATQIVNGTYKGKLSDDHRKMLKNNTSFMFLNSSKLAEKFPVDELGVTQMKQVMYLLNNLGTFTFSSSKVKGNSVTTEMKWNFPEGKGNALEYLFGLIENMQK